MPNTPSSPLPRSIQRTIDATNIPFRAIAYLCTPIINTVRSTWHLLRRICRQNWIFLCIFHLHLWQLFKDSPPIRPLARYWTRIVAALLFAGCAAPAALILHASIPLFRAYWENGRDKSRARILQYLALFVFACAPACAVLSAVATAVYFVWKQRRYGEYRVSMRKLGKGYWADPRDFEDWRKWESRKDAVERLKVWGATEEKESFVVDILCVGCGAVKSGLSRRCKLCGAYDEKSARRMKA